jgi:hypothetical protein
VDYPADGADITVVRSVFNASGALMFGDNIQTQYNAWQAVYQYGRGTVNPKALLDQGLCH